MKTSLPALLTTISCVFVMTACSDAALSGSPAPAPAPSTSASAPDAGAGDAAAPAKLAHGVLVIGPLAAADVDSAKAQHDPLASGGEAQAKAAGDVGHAALVSTTRLGTKANEFLGFDRWSAPDNLDAFYANPDFAAAFGKLFSGPPTRGVYVKRADWAGWGDLDQRPGRFWVAVRGVLKEKDEAKARAAHDAVARGGEAAAKQAGDVAHVVYLSRDTPAGFLAFDVWSDADALEKFYADPQVQAGFGGLFEAAPTVGVYGTTDFHQW